MLFRLYGEDLYHGAIVGTVAHEGAELYQRVTFPLYKGRKRVGTNVRTRAITSVNVIFNVGQGLIPIRVTIQKVIMSNVLYHLPIYDFFRAQNHRLQSRNVVRVEGARLSVVIESKRVVRIHVGAPVICAKAMVKVVSVQFIFVHCRVTIFVHLSSIFPVDIHRTRLVIIMYRNHVTRWFAIRSVVPPSNNGYIPPIRVSLAIMRMRAHPVIVQVTIVFLVLFMIMVIFSFMRARGRAATVKGFVIRLNVSVVRVMVMFFILQGR